MAFSPCMIGPSTFHPLGETGHWAGAEGANRPESLRQKDRGIAVAVATRVDSGE